MNTELYTGTPREYMDAILQCRQFDYAQVAHYCQLLLSYGKKKKDAALIGFSLYYTAEYHYTYTEIEQALSSLLDAIRHLEQANDSKTMMLDFIQQNMADYELCAASVAERFHVPEKKVYEAVRSKTGMTFKEYLTSLRMKKAAELLYTTREGIAEIAQQCGYQGSSTFYRLFQEYHGMTPGQYRRAEKPDTAD